MNVAIYPGLSPKMIEAYEAIRSLAVEHGRSPSCSELATRLGLRSKSGVGRLLDSLQERGYVKRLKYRAYSIIALDAPTSDVPAANVLRPQTQAALEAYCRLHGEKPEAIVDDAVTTFLDERENDIARETAVVLS